MVRAIQTIPTARELYEQYEPLIAKRPSGCWLWMGYRGTQGYGSVTVKRRSLGYRKVWRVHRLVYEALVGPVADGFDLHHECETPHCVNPAHLVALTHGDHSRTHGYRGGPHGPRTGRSEVCLKCGADDWYVFGNGSRRCRPCSRESGRRWRARKIEPA